MNNPINTLNPTSKLSTLARLASGLLLACANTLALAEDGQVLFDQNCAACHGEGGIGTIGLAPPLQNTELWGKLGDNAPNYIANVMSGGLSGKINSQGVDYVGLVMPPQSHLTSEEMTQIADYVLTALNGLSKAPTPQQIEDIRQKPASHKELRALREGAPATQIAMK